MEKKYTLLELENKLLKEENCELKNKITQLSKTSANSSKSPSSDIVKQPKTPPSSRRLKIGAQVGHPKYDRVAFTSDQVHDVLEYTLAQCPHCSHAVDIDLNKAPKVIQQVELVQAPIRIEEHRSHAYWCENCKQHHYGQFAAEVLKAGLFKAQLTSLVAYLKNVCHCSFSNIRKYICDVLQLKVSRGYLSKLIQKVSASLTSSYQELLSILPFASSINVDETGHKENGETFWTWVFRTDLYVLFKIDKSRGSQVLIEVLGKEFNGVLGQRLFFGISQVHEGL